MMTTSMHVKILNYPLHLGKTYTKQIEALKAESTKYSYVQQLINSVCLKCLRDLKQFHSKERIQPSEMSMMFLLYIQRQS